METNTVALPVSQTIDVQSTAEVQAVIQEAAAQQSVVYPLGGATSSHYGMPAREPGWAIDLRKLNQVVDYPARDLTVTVNAGLAWRELTDLLSAENQELPFDPPDSDRATVGGIVACAWSGPRRLAYGSVRDYVIGIEAVDGLGRHFHGGGRVVKNVAGYDFCKLLTGSMGTLGVITQLTFRLRPQAEACLLLALRVTSLEAADDLAKQILAAAVRPATVGVTLGEYWRDSPLQSSDLHLIVGAEGLREEVDHMHEQLDAMTRPWGTPSVFREPEAWSSMRESIAGLPNRQSSPLVLRAKTVGSGAIPWARAALQQNLPADLFADLGVGMVDVAFEEPPSGGLSQLLVRDLQPQAAKFHGHVRTLWNESGQEMTHQSVWGELGSPVDVMWQVKQAFDPHNILNRDRYVW